MRKTLVFILSLSIIATIVTTSVLAQEPLPRVDLSGKYIISYAVGLQNGSQSCQLQVYLADTPDHPYDPDEIGISIIRVDWGMDGGACSVFVKSAKEMMAEKSSVQLWATGDPTKIMVGVFMWTVL